MNEEVLSTPDVSPNIAPYSIATLNYVHTPQLDKLGAALAKAEGKIEVAKKDADNPYFKSKYADLATIREVCREPLAAEGLSILQIPTAQGNTVHISTKLLHESGQWIASELILVAKDTTPQSIGSCITYGRRYALAAMLGIASDEDDDGNAASGRGDASQATHNRTNTPNTTTSNIPQARAPRTAASKPASAAKPAPVAKPAEEPTPQPAVTEPQATAPAAEAAPEAPAAGVTICSDCGKPITNFIAPRTKREYTAETLIAESKKTYGIPLCAPCMQQRARATAAAIEQKAAQPATQTVQ
jgi:ribosomal protein L34E